MSQSTSWVSKNRPGSANQRRAKQTGRQIGEALFARAGQLKLGRKHRPDYLMVVLIMILALTGLVVLFSIAPAITSGNDTSQAAFMWRQGLFLAIGLTAFFIASRIPLDFWRKAGGWLFIAALILCLLVPIFGMLKLPFVTYTLGAYRWFTLADVASFQPAEFLKFGLVLFTAGFLAVRSARGQLNSPRTLLPLALMVFVALFIIVILQKDLGTGLALVAIVLTQLFIAGVRLRTIGLAVTIVAAAGLAAIVIAPHRLERIATFFGQGNVETDYHINQAMIALGSGGLTGRGLGQSVQAFGWLPEVGNDSIFAILGETLGFIGLVLVILMFGLLLKRIIGKVDYTDNAFLRLILAGVFGWLAAHVILNIGAMTHIVPLTGITLPLVSFGGTSMLFVMAALGLVFAISRYTLHRKVKLDGKEDDQNDKDSLRRRWQRRSHYANRSGR
jgi:cell division protein FtsW